MELHITGDGAGYEVRLNLRWHSLRSLLIAIGALLAAPVVARVEALLGW